MPGKLATSDGLIGLLFIAIGTVTLIVSYGYGLGTMQRIGPGVFPFGAGLLLSVIGLISLLKPIAAAEEEAFRVPRARALFPILAIIAFALLIQRGGLLVTTFAVVLIAGRAERWAVHMEELALAVGLALGCYVIFVWFLGMSMRMLPSL